ncbi:DUF2975 domain-containing protein [Paenibacillus hexagrammi]|uniref:DUF2975 domain-containing protein n=1 Tax=Paenibacillus hexagrammi TaxID=2908839 RepID=A0ABY3SDD9_9BACL|nr:DUF2975 domain-containing protein [Paenibacillus sp. YPD9-1]UJF31438.1 DUF2975 domain-containing protein [Paenibacillus sp. YPD9-1]
MKRGTTLFLKTAVILIGIPILALCLFVVPKFGNFAGGLYPELAYIKPLVFIDMYAAAIPFYFALYQVFKILGNIDRNQAFSELSVKALKKIKYCAITISSLYLLGMPLYSLLARRVDPPIITGPAFVIIFASIVIAVFAAVLQRLLQEAINMKAENDLTI